MVDSGKWFIFGVLSVSLHAGTQADFDPNQRIWNLSNGSIAASFQLTPEGKFLTRQFSDLRTGDTWNASPDRLTSPIRLQTETDPSLLGGAVLRAGDLVIDGSVRARLDRIAYELTA